MMVLICGFGDYWFVDLWVGCMCLIAVGFVLWTRVGAGLLA